MNIDRDRRLQENEDESRRIKEELVSLYEAILCHENALNALAIERTNLESLPGEELLEITPELQESLQSLEVVTSRRIWPKVAIGALMFAGVLLGLSGLGMFNNDGSTSVARRVIPTPSPVDSPSRGKEKDEPIVSPSSTPQSTHPNLTSDKIHSIPNEIPMNILPGITYTSEISYSMKSSNVALVEVQDTPQITLHLNRAPQSFFIPLKTPFRVDSEGMNAKQFNGRLIVLTDRKKHDLEIRFESRRLLPETQLYR